MSKAKDQQVEILSYVYNNGKSHTVYLNHVFCTFDQIQAFRKELRKKHNTNEVYLTYIEV